MAQYVNAKSLYHDSVAALRLVWSNHRLFRASSFLPLSVSLCIIKKSSAFAVRWSDERHLACTNITAWTDQWQSSVDLANVCKCAIKAQCNSTQLIENRSWVESSFCCAMLCKRGLCHGVMPCLSVPSVRPVPSVTFVRSVKMSNRIFKTFSQSGSQTILVFPYQASWQYCDGFPLTETEVG